MQKTLFIKAALSMVVAGCMMPSTRVFADESGLTETDLSETTTVTATAQPQKVDDVVTGVEWLGKKVGHGTKVTAEFVFNKGVKPVAIGAGDLAEMAEKGSVYVTLKVVHGAKKATIMVDHVLVNGSEVVYKDALRPLIIKPVVAAGKLVFVDGAYKMILKPAAVAVDEAAKNDVVTGIKDGARSEREGADATGKDISHDSEAVYSVVLKPVGDGIADAAEATGRATKAAVRATFHGTAKVACHIANGTYRDEPKSCENPQASAQMKVDQN